MPTIRQPLRKRCNVQLSVITRLSNDSSSDAVLISKEENTVRGRPQRSQRRKAVAKRKNLKSPHHYLKEEVAVTIPSPLPLPPHSKGIHLQSYCELIPFLSIALSDGPFDPSTILPPTTSAVPFTHFVRIQYASPCLGLYPGHARSEYHLKTDISVLTLIVPAPKLRQKATRLSEHQLLLSRDFLSLALPYYCRSEPPTWADESPSGDMVHVLITAPPSFSGCTCISSGAVDVMSIVACYLIFAGGEKMTTVLECVDTEMDTLGLGLADVWKGRVKGDAVEVIQRVAIDP